MIPGAVNPRVWWAVRSKTGDTVIMILEQINGPEELKALPPEDLKILAQEIRTFLIEKISHTGGHLAPIWAWWN